MLKKGLTGIILLIIPLCAAGCDQGQVDTLTYAVFPYLPDVEYYQEIIESRWAEIEPDIKLKRAEWDCYKDSAPEGIDVIMFDAVMRDTIIDSGWVQPIGRESVTEIEDIFPFTIEGLTVGDKLYGIPVFLCGNFLIYDQGSEELARAEHITDLADKSEILVVNSESPENRPQYIIEVIADTLGEINPSVDDNSENSMELIDRLAIEDHKKDDDMQVALAYDSGIGMGYIGFSESMRLLKDRGDKTGIKSISFSDQEDVLRLYEDAAAITADVEGQRYDKCLKLINVMAEGDVLTRLSVQKEAPQYLMLARETPYQSLEKQFPLYKQIKTLVADERNHIILTP